MPCALASPVGVLADRYFRYLIVWPAILVLLLIGLFPLVYSAIVSFQKINRRVEDTSFHGLLNYGRLAGSTLEINSQL